MLQRIGLAQAILHDPEIIFLDEPMSGLDPVGRKMVKDLMLQLKKEKISELHAPLEDFFMEKIGEHSTRNHIE